MRFLVYGGIGGAHVHGNADFGEVAPPFGGNAFVVLLGARNSKVSGLPCLSTALPFCIDSRLFKQGACFEQVWAHAWFGSVTGGIGTS